jgi:hypothetical protein
MQRKGKEKNFGTKKDKENVQLGTRCNVKLCGYLDHSVDGIVKYRRVRWAGNMATTEE